MDPSSLLNKIYTNTPLIPSDPLSRLAGRDVYLKLENLQPSGSFKSRGVGNRVFKAVMNGATHIVSSSGGNAGLAALYAARVLNVRITIVVPQTTARHVVEHMVSQGATVEIQGCCWIEAHEYANQLAKSFGGVLVHPFDHPDIWEGIKSLVMELPEQPAAMIVSVGGGGLATGVIHGLRERGWSDTTVITMETQGADCFNQALKQKMPVILDKINSVATSLGADKVCEELFHLSKIHPVISSVISDADAVGACLRFADDHKMLVEPACGAALAAVYFGVLKKAVVQRGGPIVVVACGGYVKLQQLVDLRTRFGLDSPVHYPRTMLHSLGMGR